MLKFYTGRVSNPINQLANQFPYLDVHCSVSCQQLIAIVPAEVLKMARCRKIKLKASHPDGEKF